MLLKDIIISAAGMLSLDRVLNLPELGGAEDDDSAKKDLSILIRCANLVINEAATEYIRPRKKQKVTAGQNGFIDYAAFDGRVCDVISIRDALGRKVSFKAGALGIETSQSQGAELWAEYVFVPPALEPDDEVGFSRANINERILGYGTAAEYCVIGGLFDEAALWDKRYKDALRSALKSGAEIKIKAQGWY